MNRFEQWWQQHQRQALVARVQALGPQLVLAAILLLTLAVYAPTLTDWFLRDDFWFLRAAQTASSPWVWVRDSLDFRNPGPPMEFSFYRPLYQASFLGFYKLFGLNAWAYHLLSVSVHLANAALVWLIARKLTNRLLIAHAAALIFALHPAYSIAVTWVTAGNAVLTMLPFLSSLWLFLKHLDGGPRRLWYYAASFVAFVLALLFHPEALMLTVLIVLAYGLLYAKEPRDLLAVEPWLRLVPFVVTAFAYFVIQSWVREQSIEQTIAFRFGPWFDDNYLRYLALAIYPFDPGSLTSYTARHIVFTIAFLLTSAVVGVAGPRRGHATTFVLYWFFIALIPLSTFALGALSRKLYTAGPGLAILLAMFVAVVWDARPRRLGAWAPALALAIVVPIVGVMVSRGIELRAGHRHAMFQSKQLLEQVQDAHPSLAPDARVYIVGVPWLLTLFTDSYVRDELRLYYGDIEVRAFGNEAELDEADLERRDDDIVIHYRPSGRSP